MRKLFFIFMLMCCGFLYAETYRTGDLVCFSLDKPEINYSSMKPQYRINSIIPYESGYLIKCTHLKDNYSLDFFINKGFIFYTHSLYSENTVHYECKITDIKPNEFVFEKKELKFN